MHMIHFVSSNRIVVILLGFFPVFQANNSSPLILRLTLRVGESCCSFHFSSKDLAKTKLQFFERKTQLVLLLIKGPFPIFMQRAPRPDFL